MLSWKQIHINIYNVKDILMVSYKSLKIFLKGRCKSSVFSKDSGGWLSTLSEANPKIPPYTTWNSLQKYVITSVRYRFGFRWSGFYELASVHLILMFFSCSSRNCLALQKKNFKIMIKSIVLIPLSKLIHELTNKHYTNSFVHESIKFL